MIYPASIPKDKWKFIYYIDDRKDSTKSIVELYRPVEAWILENYLYMTKKGLWAFIIHKKSIKFYFTDSDDATYFRLRFPHKLINEEDWNKKYAKTN